MLLAAASANAAVEPTTQPVAVPATQPTSQPTTQEAKDWRAIRGAEAFRRSFLLRREGQLVGTCAFTVRMFQNGEVTRTGLEYHAFGSGKKHPTAHVWFQGYCSERTGGAAFAEWATGREGELGMNFRINGAGAGKAHFRGSLFNIGYRNPSIIDLPDGYRLLQVLAAELRRAVAKGMGHPFVWKRYIWREWEPTWRDFRYTYEGPDKVSPVGGTPVEAYRFRIDPLDKKSGIEMLWVDAQGYPLRRTVEVPAGKPWEMIATEHAIDDRTKLVGWKEAQEKFRDQAESFIQSFGVWY
ncbi:MAG: PT domain-containing protein [Phycisphaerae bacterium]|nr:PT domain-containing protein [Phycisphaerae bacterium]